MRDKLANATEADRRIVAESTEWAHGGDVVVDASLYLVSGGRTDSQLIQEAVRGFSANDLAILDD